MFDFISGCILLVVTSPIILLALLLSGAILEMFISCIKSIIMEIRRKY